MLDLRDLGKACLFDLSLEDFVQRKQDFRVLSRVLDHLRCERAAPVAALVGLVKLKPRTLRPIACSLLCGRGFVVLKGVLQRLLESHLPLSIASLLEGGFAEGRTCLDCGAPPHGGVRIVEVDFRRHLS